jgi:hypothetical protein
MALRWIQLPMASQLVSAMLVLLAASAAGCQQRTKQDYTPSAARSRECLERALTQWQTGVRDASRDGEPNVQLADSIHDQGGKLQRFEILGELPSEDGRRFSVRLALQKPEKEQDVTYVLIGIDPVWVIRLDDYEMFTHWDHKMTPPEPELPLESEPTSNAEPAARPAPTANAVEK